MNAGFVSSSPRISHKIRNNISLLSEYLRKFDFWYKLSYESGKRYKRVMTLRDMYSPGNDHQQSGGAPGEETKDQDQRGWHLKKFRGT